jgi:TRAP-type transport system small permease protein
MTGTLAALDKAIGFAEDAVSVAALVAITVVVVLQVFLRYVLDTGILWSDEVVAILMVTMVMFGAPAVTRRAQHTELLVFVRMMPSRVRRPVRLLTNLVGLAFLVLFLYASARYAVNAKGMVTTVMRIPVQYVYALLPVGAALALYEFVKAIPASIGGKDPAP